MTDIRETLRPYDSHMKWCPKCGSHDFKLPRYVPARSLHCGAIAYKEPEHMIWECRRCGYSETTACLDGRRGEGGP
jgi:predicted nucleic-acid-binding Zn-ribbon protein